MRADFRTKDNRRGENLKHKREGCAKPVTGFNSKEYPRLASRRSQREEAFLKAIAPLNRARAREASGGADAWRSVGENAERLGETQLKNDIPRSRAKQIGRTGKGWAGRTNLTGFWGH
jgi:hypothetical protein